MTNIEYQLCVISKAISQGFDTYEDEKICDAFDKAREYLIDNTAPTYERCELSGGKSQNYLFIDENGVNFRCSGEISDYGRNAKAEDLVIFTEFDEDGEPVWCNCFDICRGGEYFFVYDIIVTSNGEVVTLYDMAIM